jgi:hypothetical protein
VRPQQRDQLAHGHIYVRPRHAALHSLVVASPGKVARACKGTLRSSQHRRAFRPREPPRSPEQQAGRRRGVRASNSRGNKGRVDLEALLAGHCRQAITLLPRGVLGVATAIEFLGRPIPSARAARQTGGSDRRATSFPVGATRSAR